MLREILNNKSRAASVVLLVSLLALVRVFEDTLFYDPFANYFKGDYLNLAFPEVDAVKLFFGLSFRYWLNSALSVAVIFVLFSELELVKFTTVLYLIFYAVLMAAFFLMIEFSDSSNNFMLFYIRRFLIQPLFLLLFVPAFYYQRRTEKK